MSEFFDRIKNTKGSLFLLVGLIAGLILIVMGNGGFGEDKSEITEPVPDVQAEAVDYISELERRVGDLLSRMDGISEVSVIIMPDTTAETVYAQNGSYDGGVLTEKEYVITDVDGDGKPIKVKIIFPKLRGVAVVCRGGANPINQEKIMSLLTSLFDLPSNRVYVAG